MEIKFMKTHPDAVIPKADDHVNLHNYCMHLWSEWNEKMGGIHAR